MLTFYASADGPAVRLIRHTFHATILIVCQATYGRVLFRPEIEIRDCTFLPEVG